MKRILTVLLSLFVVSVSLPAADLRHTIRSAEVKHDIPEKLLYAVIKIESGLNPKAINGIQNKGVATASFGLGQLTRQTAAAHCGLYSMPSLLNPNANIDCSAKVLQYQLRRYSGDVNRALAAYNWGTPCECNGKVFIQNLNGKNNTCATKAGKTLTCKIRGTFWNQKYVDKVMNAYLADL